MNLEQISQKHRNDLEIQVRELQNTLRKAKLYDEPIMEMLRQLEQRLSDARRKSFDSATSDYQGY